MKDVKIYIGWDSREPIAADVCEYSIHKHAPKGAQVEMLKLQELRDAGIYTRPHDKLGSTEFTFSRFYVPYLNDFKGYAIFCDCDFLWKADWRELMDQIDKTKAVTVVKHDYQPQEGIKMDGQKQLPYPRKNWSSMMVFNCEHPKNKQLSLDLLNNKEIATGAFLHRFKWLDDADIGHVDCVWNWLVDWYKEPQDGKPKVLHYTEGGPWFDEYKDCSYSADWYLYEHELAQKLKGQEDPKNIGVSDLDLALEYKDYFNSVIQFVTDPNNQFHRDNLSLKAMTGRLKALVKHSKILTGISEPGEIKTKQDNTMDAIVANFVKGTGGSIKSWDKTKDEGGPIALRSITKRKIMHRCLDEGRDFYYIDTGYFGNHVKTKRYHRITKNAMQFLGDIEEKPSDRFDRTGARIKPHKGGDKILVCPPSDKAMKYWGLGLDEWMEQTIEEIKKHTDRPIEIRLKQPRSVRVTDGTLEQALNNNVHALVTFNSIAALESLMFGTPAFALGPNAAHHFANSDLADLETPFMPEQDQVHQLCCNLAYHQFTPLEMTNGTAWSMLQEHYNK